jgi:SAM-dependent methyltransferase
MPTNKSVNYNLFHVKNRNTQKHRINFTNYTYQTILKLLKTHLQPDMEVLDLGCGVGTVDFFIADKCKYVVGVDISSKAIKMANKSRDVMGVNNATFICGDVTELDFRDKFDFVICSEVIEHINDYLLLMLSINTYLKKGGLLLLSTPLKSAPLYRWGYLENFERRVGHLSRLDIGTLTTLCKESNFTVIEQECVEGILRNFLFTNDYFGSLIRLIKWPVTIIVNAVDLLLLRIFGASNIYLLAKKV